MEIAPSTLLWATFAAGLFMTGLIWFVQIVHYPLFAAVGEDAFIPYQHRHMQRTTWVVALPMAVETVAAFALLLHPGAYEYAWLIAISSLVAVIIASTALLQVPDHERLARHGLARAAHRRLVTLNWIRTSAWTAKSAISVVLLSAPSV